MATFSEEASNANNEQQTSTQFCQLMVSFISFKNRKRLY